MASVYLEVDASDLQEKINTLKANLTPERFDQVMYGIFSRTGGKVKRILRTELPQDYNIKAAEVGSTVGAARVSGGGGGTGCTIPVKGQRRHIGGGGKGFTARGHRQGWKSLTSGHYNISAHVYRGEWGTLPAYMSNYGGKPPFRNIPSKLGGLTFTRMGQSRLPIAPVMGIAIPQMPMNRSEPDVQAEIRKFMEERIAHEIGRLLGGS